MKLIDLKLSTKTIDIILKAFKDHPKLSNYQDEVPNNLLGYTDKVTKDLLENMTQISNPPPDIEQFATQLGPYILIVVLKTGNFSNVRVI